MHYVSARKTAQGTVEIYMPRLTDSGSYLFATFGKDDSKKPTYRNKYVTLNCFKYGINWVKGN